MTTLVLDTGALIALDRGDRRVWSKLSVAFQESDTVQVPTGALAQARRGGNRQARLANALKGVREVPLDSQAARQAGVLCGETNTVDVVDASVVVAAAGAERLGTVEVFTSDGGDLRRLLTALNSGARIVNV